MLRPLRVCDRQKRKRLRNRCFATATDINGCSVARSIEGTMVSTARSIEITKVRQFKSRVLMYSYATRGLGFLVRCATISRQLGQRSGGSPLFMINHRSSNNNNNNNNNMMKNTGEQSGSFGPSRSPSGRR